MTGVTVRQTIEDDWATWRDLRLRALQDTPTAFGSTYEREVAYTELDWRNYARSPAEARDDSAGPSLLAYVDGVAVGMGGGYCDRPGWLHVVAMWTDPAWRGRGVGRAVLGHVVGWAEERGQRVELWVADVNPGARRLYEGWGFRADGRREPMREGSLATKTHLVL